MLLTSIHFVLCSTFASMDSSGSRVGGVLSLPVLYRGNMQHPVFCRDSMHATVNPIGTVTSGMVGMQTLKVTLQLCVS